MGTNRFDASLRLCAQRLSRRFLLLPGGLLTANLLGLPLISARKRKRKKKKATLCLDGQTLQASKKKKRKLLKRGATPGACPLVPPSSCVPTCAGIACGGDDGCGGICGCAAGSLCHSGVCHPCAVTCGGDGATCGVELASALNGGGTIYACPGRYTGNFSLTAANITLIGAGDGDDPASNTILDAIGSGTVVKVDPNVNAALHGLRITGGNQPQSTSGGGVRNLGTLTMTACTVDRNTAGGAGGIYQVSGATGALTLNNCVVSRNSGRDGAGGGIFNSSNETVAINGSALTGNAAAVGGGLANRGTVTFDNASSVTDNSASHDGGGINNDVGGTVNLNGATVSGNDPNNCVDVDDCVG